MKLKPLLLLLLALLGSTTLYAYDAEIDGIYYNFPTDSTATVTYRNYQNYQYFSDYSGSVAIPEFVTYNGTTYSVTSIGYCAFSGCSGLTSVTIPNSVTSIGSNAFSDCTGLTSITIPESVTSIGGSAFSGCSSLATITIPESVTSIGGGAFDGTAWYNNQPDGLIYVGNFAYKYKGTIQEGIQIIIAIKEGTIRIVDGAFRDCTNLISVTIPNSVTTIGEYAFEGCIGLTSIIIPDGVTIIGGSAFEDCSGLTSVTLGKGLTRIGWDAFENCSSLTSITIPENVIEIEEEAFRGCKLRNVLIKCITPPEMDAEGGHEDGSFSVQTFRHGMLYVPAGCWDAYAFDEEWCYFNNIRETVTAEEQVSEQQAYTLMDANTFAYSVYDPVNDCIGTLSVNGIDENNPNHSWQVIEADGKQFLYNLGAKKFVVSSANGSYSLSDEATPINMEDGENGIIIGTQASKQWALVSNESMSVEQAIITGVSPLRETEEGAAIYNLSGQRLNKMQRGINIVGGRKVLVK